MSDQVISNSDSLSSVGCLKSCIKWAGNLSHGFGGSVQLSYMTPADSFVCRGTESVKKRKKCSDKVSLVRREKKYLQKKTRNTKIINWDGGKVFDEDKQHFQDDSFSSIPLENFTFMGDRPWWTEDMGKCWTQDDMERKSIGYLLSSYP